TPLLAGFARCRLSGRPVGARLEMQIAQPSLTALGEQRARSVLREIGHELAGFGIGDDGADRDAQHDIFGAASILVGATPLLAVLGAVDACVTVIDQRIDVAIGDCVDAAAASAVAAVGPAPGHVLLTSKRDRAIAAVPGDHLDDGFVDEFHDASPAMRRRRTSTNPSVSSPRRRPSHTLFHAESGGAAESLLPT